MPTAIQLTLPTPPSNNNYKRHFCTRSVTHGPGRDIHTVRAALTDRAKEYKQTVVDAAWEARTSMIDGEVRVRVVVHEGKQRIDLDNIPKVLFDALNGIAWRDDSQIAEYTVRRVRGVYRKPYVEVFITPLEDAS